jgi:HEAT repeat protein
MAKRRIVTVEPTKEASEEAEARKELERLRARAGGSREQVALVLDRYLRAALDAGKDAPFWVYQELRAAPHPSAVPALVELVRARRPWASITLGDFGPMASAAVPALRGALAHDGEDMRAYAAGALGSIGRAAAPALRDLLRSAKAPEEWVRYNSLKSIRDIGPTDECLPVLIEAMEDTSWIAREYSAHALAALGPSARAAIPALRRAAAGGESAVVKAAKNALVAIGANER